jgi:DNA-binding LytR/AlgR family response regulator
VAKPPARKISHLYPAYFIFDRTGKLIATEINTMLRTIILDDEPIALDITRSFIEKIPFIELMGAFTDAFQALEWLRREKADLLFLDIRMPDISGIELLKTLTDPPMTIFTTAYSEHAVESFELNTLDYLLKPFSFPRFLKACNKALEQFQLRQAKEGAQLTQAAAPARLFIKTGYEKIRIFIDDIEYIQSAGNYVQFVVAGEKILSRLTMTEAEALLPEGLFTRIHRSFIVANAKIIRVDRWSLWVGDMEIPIGPGYAAVAAHIFR